MRWYLSEPRVPWFGVRVTPKAVCVDFWLQMVTPLTSGIWAAAALGVPWPLLAHSGQRGHVSHVPLLLSLETPSRCRAIQV